MNGVKFSMSATIRLVKTPSIEDYESILFTAQLPCECTAKMKMKKAKGDVTCKRCAARSILNGIITLAETLREGK